MSLPPLNVFFVGAVDGQILQLYRSIRTMEEHLGLPCHWVVGVGHMGIWPSTSHMPDLAKKKRGLDPGDFPKLLIDGWQAPRPTVFVAGTQDAHKWMNIRAKEQRSLDVLAGMTWLRNGNTTTIGTDDVSVRLLGIGKSYSPNTYNNQYSPRRASHYRRSEINRACSVGRVDILVTHVAPDGVTLQGRTSNAQGITNVIAAVRPRLLVHGGLKASEVYEHLGLSAICLDRGDIQVVQFRSNADFNII